MVSDGVGGYHGQAELDLLRWRAAQGTRGRARCVVSKIGGGVGVGMVVVQPSSPRPPRKQHRGSMPGPVSVRQQSGSSSVALPLVVKWIGCAVVAALNATHCGSCVCDYR
jgi:hypothetical protein